jgi:ubiquinol-cytochrome c reductase cytochrome c subunit
MLGVVLAALFASAAFAVAQGHTSPANSAYVPAGQTRAPGGRRLYEEYCSSCHGSIGQGSPIAPPLIGIGDGALDFMLGTGRMPIPTPDVQPQRQPSIFSQSELAALTGYIDSLSRGAPGRYPVPHVDLQRGDLARGRVLFALNCAGCHGAVGAGATVGYGDYAPNLWAATPTQIGEAVRLGPQVMPRFGPQTIDDADLNSLALYVTSLRRPDDRGGASLGQTGPLGEGFVGVTALGVMLLASRAIGTKT